MDRDDLMIKLRALMLDIIGVEIYNIDLDEDLRKKQSFDQGSEEIFKECIDEEFNIDMDLSQLNPLTFVNIADYMIQEKQYGLKKPGLKNRQGEKETKKRKEVIANKNNKKNESMHQQNLLVF